MLRSERQKVKSLLAATGTVTEDDLLHLQVVAGEKISKFQLSACDCSEQAGMHM